MLRPCLFFRAALILLLVLPTALAAQMSHDPHYLPGIEAALDQLRALSPHFAPGKMDNISLSPARGYALSRVDVSQQDVKLYFSQAPAQRIEYFLLWRKGATAPAYDPYTGDSIIDIVFAKTTGFQIYNFTTFNPPYPTPWCAVPIPIEANSKAVTCLTSEAEAEQLVDTLATLIAASGGQIVPGDGFGVISPVSDNYLRKHRNETGGYIASAEAGEPPTLAGIQGGDILHAIDGKPYVCGQGMLDKAIEDGVRGKSEAVLHVDIFRGHKPMSFDIHYSTHPDLVARLRQQGKELAETPAPSPAASAPAAASSATPAAPPAAGQKFGFQVRAVTDADVAPLGLAKARGIVVVDVDKGGLADKMGILPGDVILSVNNSEIGDLQLFVQIVQSGEAKAFHIWRKGQALVLAVPLSL